MDRHDDIFMFNHALFGLEDRVFICPSDGEFSRLLGKTISLAQCQFLASVVTDEEIRWGLFCGWIEVLVGMGSLMVLKIDRPGSIGNRSPCSPGPTFISFTK